jgi:hypothetical protein
VAQLDPALAPGRGKAGANQVRTDEEIARDLEVAFTTDGPPDAASAKRSATIVQGLGGPLAKGAHLRKVDCRATRCKLELEFADRNADSHLMSGLFRILRSVGVKCEGLGYQVAKREVLPNGTIVATVHLFDAPRP